MSKSILLSDEELLNLYLFLYKEVDFQKEILNNPDTDDDAFSEATTNVEMLTPIQDKIFKYLKQNVTSVNGMSLTEFLHRSV